MLDTADNFRGYRTLAELRIEGQSDILTPQGQYMRRLRNYKAHIEQSTSDAPTIKLTSIIGEDWTRIPETDIYAKEQPGPHKSEGYTILMCDWIMPSDKPASVMPHHRHDQKETLFILEGEQYLTIEGELVVIRAGESITIEQGISHGAHVDRRCVFLAIFQPELSKSDAHTITRIPDYILQSSLNDMEEDRQFASTEYISIPKQAHTIFSVGAALTVVSMMLVWILPMEGQFLSLLSASAGCIVMLSALGVRASINYISDKLGLKKINARKFLDQINWPRD